MQKESSIVVIGMGKMGSAIALRLVQCGVNVTLTARSKTAQERWLLAHPSLEGVNIVVGNEVAREAGVVLLAVKPANLSELYLELKGQLAPNCLVISVVAGATVSALSDGLNHQRVVRAMPNLAAEYGEAVTVWYSQNLEEEYLQRASGLFGQLGKEYRVNMEKHIDQATALFGSGPAFVYYFMEAMVEAGMLIGFPKDRLRELMVQMVRGTAVLAEQHSTTHLAQLRDDISSTGGTTVEGIMVLDKYSVRAAIKDVIKATLEKVWHLAGPK